MPHRSSRSRRYAGRALVLSVLGWALFSRERDEQLEALPSVELEPSRELPVHEVVDPAVSRREPSRRRSPKRRLATSLAFATLFFAGAALSAGAGDMIAEAVEATGSTSTEAVTTSEEAPPEEAPAEEPAEEEPVVTEPSEGGEGSEPDPGDGGEGEPVEEPVEAPAEGESPGTGGDTGGGQAPDNGTDGGGSNEPQPEPQGPPLIDDEDNELVNIPTPPDPEVGEASGGATIWLHRSLPDPTPSARRLAPAFAKALRVQSRRAGTDWALVLGVLRADGRTDRVPASAAELRSLAARLVELGARKDEWQALVGLRGRTAFADRAQAATRLHRAVGLRALVTGLEAAKRSLEQRVLTDSRISIYGGGRSDVAAHRIDIRVLVTLRYLAESFGQVTVSSLQSGHRVYSRPGVVSAHTYGLAVDIASLGNLSILGNQAPGSITEQAVRAILLLPAGLQARQVISLIGLGGASFAMADHHDHIHIGF